MMLGLCCFTSLPEGVSLDQILSAYHWKAHKKFTRVYMKDMAFTTSMTYILLVCQLSDEEAQNLHQVRAHDVRPLLFRKPSRRGLLVPDTLSLSLEGS